MDTEGKVLDLLLVHDDELKRLKETAPLLDLVVVHDAELSKLKSSLPSIGKEIERNLGATATALAAVQAEKIKAELTSKQAVFSGEVEERTRFEILSQAGAIRNDLFAAHEKQMGEIRPEVVAIAKATASNVTKEFAAAQPDILSLVKKEFAEAESRTSLVNANKGEWNTSKTYNTGDIISFRGSSYLVLKQTVRGQFPQIKNQDERNPTYQILAAAGSPGPRGADGAGGGSGSGDVVGPASSTLNALPRYSDTTGKLIKDSPVTLSDAGLLTFNALGTILGDTSGALTLTAAGTNQNITLTPSGTGWINAGGVTGSTGVVEPIFQAAKQASGSSIFPSVELVAYENGQTAQAFNVIAKAGGTAASPTTAAANATVGGYRFYARANGAWRSIGNLSVSTTSGFGDSDYSSRLTLGPSTSAATFAAFDAVGGNSSTGLGSGLAFGGQSSATTSATTFFTFDPAANFSRSAAWGTTGGMSAWVGRTITDTVSSGTVATAVANSFAVPAFAASSATTFTNAANLYIAGDVSAGTNVTLTNSYGLWNVGKTRLDGALSALSTIELGHATDTTLSRVSAGVVAIEGNNILVSGGALGTPSSGTLTNCTGLPQAGTVGLTTADSPQFTAVNVGHASDTTVARGAAGVLDIEGVSVLGGAEATVASATTTDIGAAKSALVSITGTTTITGFGTVAAGTRRAGRFTGALTLTHNATSLILPGGANITTAAGDRFDAVSLGSGNWVVYSYTKADGTAVVGGGGSGQLFVPFHVAGASNTAWTNMPSAATFFLGSTAAGGQKIDLTNYTQVRLVSYHGSAAGNSGAKLIARYKATTYSHTAGDYSDIGTSEVSVDAATASQYNDTGWINLASSAKADVWIALIGTGGDGVADPTFGYTAVQFK